MRLWHPSQNDELLLTEENKLLLAQCQVTDRLVLGSPGLKWLLHVPQLASRVVA